MIEPNNMIKKLAESSNKKLEIQRLLERMI